MTKTTSLIVSNIIQMLINSPYAKFADCTIAANARFIVFEDAHLKHLKNIPFLYVEVHRLREL